MRRRRCAWADALNLRPAEAVAKSSIVRGGAPLILLPLPPKPGARAVARSANPEATIITERGIAALSHWRLGCALGAEHLRRYGRYTKRVT